MLSRLPPSPASVYQRRREAFRAAFSGEALVFAGTFRPRNYLDNAYPFRAESHFLYLVGATLDRAVLWLHDGQFEVFAAPETAAHALWEGVGPTFEQLKQATGVDAVKPLDTLWPSIAGRSVATLPTTCPLTRVIQRERLGRDWPWFGEAQLQDDDAALATAMIELRLRHDDDAIRSIETALEGTAAAHRAGMAATRPGRFEREVRAAMEHELMARNMATAYESIVTTHGDVLHNHAYHHPLQAGDMILADVGGEYEGWASDITRTWPVSGRFSATQRALYDIVLAAERHAIERVAPGVRYRDIHLEACQVLAQGLVDEGILVGDPQSLVERGVHALLFPHGVGHLLGLDVHDMEDLGDLAGYAPGRHRSDQFGLAYLRLDRDLQPGMIFTIEPGLYRVPAILEDRKRVEPWIRDGSFRPDRLDRFRDVRGIRIEDNVLCTSDGHRVLSSNIPKDPGAVETEVLPE